MPGMIHATPPGATPQGKLQEAVPIYRQAAEGWAAQRVVVLYSLASALAQLGQRQAALEAVTQAQEADAATPGQPFAAPLRVLRDKLQPPQPPSAAPEPGQTGKGGGGGGPSGQ